MDGKQIHRVDEVLFSFTYSRRKLASQCNSKLQQLMGHSIIPELENTFDQVSNGGIVLEIDRLEIDLGTLSEEDIAEDLGEKIRQILVQALKNVIKDRVLKGIGNSDSIEPQSQNFSLVALKTFFLKGYFPAWLDSSLNLPAILKYLVSKSPKTLADLVLEVSVKSEAARKRIAYLEVPYFDQLISILIPGDADWVIGYRDTYLEIHQSESELPGPSENLEKALNLFILTFITKNSGTKFNRLSFSDRFLKSIAAHYNLDFREFLQEIAEILRQNTIENQLYRDFREAIAWVGEKNQTAEKSQEKEFVPNFRELINWLENSGENKKITDWLEKLSVSGGLSQELFRNYPAFWNSLSKSGLTKIIQILGKQESDKWLEIIYSYLALHARLSKTESQDQLKVVREIFDLAWEKYSEKGWWLSDKEDWFSVVVFHAFKRFGFKTEISGSLLNMGLNVGISHPSLILIKVKNRFQTTDSGLGDVSRTPLLAKSAPYKKQNQEKRTVSGSELFFESVFREYLNSGTLGHAFGDLAKSDLQWVLAVMLKSSNPILLDLIREMGRRNSPLLKSRILGLVEKLDRKEVLEYISRFAGPQTTELLRFNGEWVSIFKPEPKVIQRLDRQVWNSFLSEIQAGYGVNGVGKPTSHLLIGDSYFPVLKELSGPAGSAKEMVNLLQKRLNLVKSFLVYLGQNSSLSPLNLSRLRGLVSAKADALAGYGLLELNQAKGKLLRGNLNWESKGFNSSLKSGQVWQVSQKWPASYFKLLFSGNISEQELDKVARVIIEKDLILLKKYSISKSFETSYSAQLNEGVKRIFIFFQANPEPIRVFFYKNKSFLPLILHCLFPYLKGGDWGKFSTWMEAEFPKEWRIFHKMRDPGNDSVLGSLLSLKEVSKKGISDFKSWEQHFLFSDQVGLKGRDSVNSSEGYFSKGLIKEMEYLLGLPSEAFYKKSLSVRWKKGVLLSAFQSRIEGGFGKSGAQRAFWEFFLNYLRENRSVFSPENFEWGYLIYSGKLEAESTKLLARFFRNTYLKSNDLEKKPNGLEGIASAIIYLNEKGYMPWWSPIKSKAGLVSSLMTFIELSKKENAFLLIPLISETKSSVLLGGINLEDLKHLLSRLLKSSHKRHYSPLIQALEARIQGLDKSAEALARMNETEISETTKSPEYFKALPPEKLDLWIKKKVNASKESEILDLWFAKDPKIKGQLEDFLAWSRFMFFGNLNSGKWKIWLLDFGFEFYSKKGNSYSASFLGHFLRHLTKSQGMVNWKVIFHQLLKNGDFPGNQNSLLKDQILAHFPFDQERKSEELASGDQVKVTNAGLILCWPFLSALFSRLKLSSGGVLPVESQAKAVYLLQYLAFGHCDFPEYELVLNKILTGMKSSQHLEKVELTQEEKNMAESLIQGMKSNWEKMKNASVEAIRETFLQREGILELGTTSNILRVRKTGVDVLLDSVSWNISVIRLPWMEKSLEVKWR